MSKQVPVCSGWFRRHLQPYWKHSHHTKARLPKLTRSQALMQETDRRTRTSEWGTHNIFEWGCAARSWKPLPYFRPKYTNFHTLFRTWLSKCIPYFRPCDVWQIRQLSIDLRRTGLRDAKNDVRVFLLRAQMSTATHVTLKMVSQTKQTEYTPYFRLEILENDTLWGATYLYGLYMGVTPPPPPGGRMTTLFMQENCHHRVITMWIISI